MTYEDELNKIAYANVTYTEFTPTATIEGLITAKIAEINELRNDDTSRPGTKGGYLALLAQKEQEREALIAQNEQIIADNTAGRAAALQDYQDALAAEKLKAEVIAAATDAWILEDTKSRLAALEDFAMEIMLS